MTGIATLANRHNVTHRALRFYEQRGLLSPTRKGRNRIYSERDEDRLELILEAKALGFAISEIPELIRQRSNGSESLVIPRDKASEQLGIMCERYHDTMGAIQKLRAIAEGKAA